MAEKEMLNITDFELLGYMEVLNLTTVTSENLKNNYRQLLLEHHSDKGGDDDVTKNITRAKRILEKCLEIGRKLPQRITQPMFGGRPMDECFPQAGTSDNFNYDEYADYAYSNHDGEWLDPKNAFKRKHRKNYNFSKPTKFSTAFGDDFDRKNEDPFNTKLGRGLSRPKKYNNGYTYEEDDEFIPNDPARLLEEADPREIRGGLLIRNPLTGFVLPDYFQRMVDSVSLEEIEFSTIKTDPMYAGLVEMMDIYRKEPSFAHLMYRTKTFIYLDWLNALQSDRTPYVGISLYRKNTFIFTANLPKLEEADLVDDRLKKGIKIRLYSCENKAMNAAAVVEDIGYDTSIVELSFEESEFNRGVDLYESGHLIDIIMSPSVFLYKAYLRGIGGIEQYEMKDLIYPEPILPPIDEEEEIKLSNCKDVSDKVKSKKNDVVFNFDQENAINSVVYGKCKPYPFMLFGPPGTGKTATLIESVKRIVSMDKQKRVLICAPSNMAADVIARAIIKQDFIQKRYVFRLYSMGADANTFDPKFQPIVCRIKENDWFYGIPCVRNLQVFRIIICTLSASIYLNLAGGMRGYFSHILIDECGQATEQETWIPIGTLAVPGETVVGLYGDPQQLGPIESVGFTKSFGYGKSMIERLMDNTAYKNQDKRLMVMLKKNYRSHASILKAASKLFYNEELITTRDNPELYKMCGWKELPNPKFPLVFHSISGSREYGSKSGSKRNFYEVTLTLEYIKKLKNHGVFLKDIGIISPYKLQCTDIKKELERNRWTDITVNSVEGFQGSERKIIIFLTTRTDNLGFLACDKRLNTSITRAQQLLVILGDDQLLDIHYYWNQFIHYCKHHGAYISSELTHESKPNVPPISYENGYTTNAPPGFEDKYSSKFNETTNNYGENLRPPSTFNAINEEDMQDEDVSWDENGYRDAPCEWPDVEFGPPPGYDDYSQRDYRGYQRELDDNSRNRYTDDREDEMRGNYNRRNDFDDVFEKFSDYERNEEEYEDYNENGYRNDRRDENIRYEKEYYRNPRRYDDEYNRYPRRYDDEYNRYPKRYDDEYNRYSRRDDDEYSRNPRRYDDEYSRNDRCDSGRYGDWEIRDNYDRYNDWDTRYSGESHMYNNWDDRYPNESERYRNRNDMNDFGRYHEYDRRDDYADYYPEGRNHYNESYSRYVDPREYDRYGNVRHDYRDEYHRDYDRGYTDVPPRNEWRRDHHALRNNDYQKYEDDPWEEPSRGRVGRHNGYSGRNDYYGNQRPMRNAETEVEGCKDFEPNINPHDENQSQMKFDDDDVEYDNNNINSDTADVQTNSNNDPKDERHSVTSDKQYSVPSNVTEIADMIRNRLREL